MYKPKSFFESLKELLFSICTTSWTACFGSSIVCSFLIRDWKKSAYDLVLQVTLHLFSKYSFLFLKGEDVLERSSELIHSGDVIKTSNGSSQSCSMFLFDHQLVYCKKVIFSSEYWNSLSPLSIEAAVTGTLTRMEIDLPVMRIFFCLKVFLSKVKVANNSL